MKQTELNKKYEDKKQAIDDAFGSTGRPQLTADQRKKQEQ